MITKFISSVTTSFHPFNARSGKTARNFLAMLPANARSTMAISINMLPVARAAEPGNLQLKFKDGKEMDLDLEKIKLREVMDEVDRHSRKLGREEELKG